MILPLQIDFSKLPEMAAKFSSQQREQFLISLIHVFPSEPFFVSI
jgi:hypothetical protein